MQFEQIFNCRENKAKMKKILVFSNKCYFEKKLGECNFKHF